MCCNCNDTIHIKYDKPTDKVEPKFKVGDWIIFNGITLYIKEVVKGYYRTISINRIPNSYDWDIDNVARLWTIQDAKDGDVLFQDLMCGKTFIYNGVNPDMAILYSFIINNDGKDVLPYHIGKPNTGIGNIEENKNIIHPATKEQRDLLFRKMKEAGYEWDANKKELKKIEQKSAEWTEEDEEMLKGVIKSCEQCGNEYAYYWLKSLKDRVQPKQDWSEEDENRINRLIAYFEDKESFTAEDDIVYANWLKSLRPQWKPSDEQIGAIEAVINNRSFQRKHLDSLYEQLKKLKG